jgi:hypothetical protein
MSRLLLRRVSASGTARSLKAPLATVLFCCVVLATLVGCAAPGEPIERKPPVAQPVSDLMAQQVGNGVSLTFTVPQETTDRRPLPQPLAIEIFRDFVAPSSANAKAASATPLVTIPPAMTSNYVAQGHFRYTDELRPEDFSQHPDGAVLYSVRTRASAKKESAPSNPVSLRIYPLPEPVSDLHAEVTHSGIQLSWSPPRDVVSGRSSTYAIFRAAVQGVRQPNASANTPSANAPLEKIVETPSTSYLDTQIQFGNSYIYSVRSVVPVGQQQPLESADSNRVTILARDVFPPAAPAGLIVVFVPAQGGEPAHLELSWNISPETDLAGYYVYRSEQSNAPGTRINSEPLPTPAFRDMNAVPGRGYFYRVTAVDQSGNESAASESVSGQVPVAGGANPQ